MIRGRTYLTALLLPLALVVTGCTEPVVVIEEPEEVETCEWLIPIGIELVNDYFYTLQQVDLGPSQGDQALLPDEVLALNARGANLDERAAELDCSLEDINKAVAAATVGLESTDPVVSAFLETIRSGVATPASGDGPPSGTWELATGMTADGGLEPAEEQAITLVVDGDGVGRGSTGCSQYTLTGVAAAGTWPIEGIEVTAEPCPSTAYEVAQEAYLDALLSVRDYAVEADLLILTGSTDSGVELRFVSQQKGSPGD
jgi:hypothetical protein